MKLGIDLSNISSGGGLTHIISLLENMDIKQYGFSKVIAWGGSATLERLPKRDWLECSHQPALDKNMFHRQFWQKVRLSSLAKKSCDILFVPGGDFKGQFAPVVAMSQNLLPFEWVEMKRYGFFSWSFIKNILRHVAQKSTFNSANGVIFLTEYAKDAVTKHLDGDVKKSAIIPHGIDEKFSAFPRKAKALSSYSKENPFRLLYVSIINVYKHHDQVIQAVAELRKSGVPIVLDLVGPSYGPSLNALNECIDQFDKDREFVNYQGACAHDQLPSIYRDADSFIFASSCENLPIIMLEAMSSGLPIASSNMGPMPEALGDAGVYFDPESSSSIFSALEKLVSNESLRETLAHKAYDRASEYSWTKTADSTLSFLQQSALSYRAEQYNKELEAAAKTSALNGVVGSLVKRGQQLFASN